MIENLRKDLRENLVDFLNGLVDKFEKEFDML